MEAMNPFDLFIHTSLISTHHFAPQCSDGADRRTSLISSATIPDRQDDRFHACDHGYILYER